MGMFDFVRCDYPITPAFIGECQTKDIVSDLGGTMDTYYIDPAGRMWVIDYYGTRDYKPSKTEGSFFLDWAPTGKHGKVKPFLLTNYITIYPSRWEGRWDELPVARLHIEQGMLRSVSLKSKGTIDANSRNDRFQLFYS